MRCFALLASLCSLIAVGCASGDLISNPDVELWCGELPCGWTATGETSRVGSWNEHDYSISLDSDTATLTQLNGTADALSAPCIAFELVAKIDPGTTVFFELDFLDDGMIDASEQLIARDWDRVSFLLKAPSWYESVRFIVRKDGPGTAIVGHLSATVSNQCTGEEVPLNDRPDGAGCDENAQCVSGHCAQFVGSFLSGTSGTCGQVCHDNLDCGQDEDCQFSQQLVSEDELIGLCMAPWRPFGAQCNVDEHCDTGVCCAGACSACCGDVDCGSGRVCGAARWPLLQLPASPRFASPVPQLCDPGLGRGMTGASCVSGADCMSLRCSEGAGLLCEESLCTGSECEQCPNLSIRAGVCE